MSVGTWVDVGGRVGGVEGGLRGVKRVYECDPSCQWVPGGREQYVETIGGDGGMRRLWRGCMSGSTQSVNGFRRYLKRILADRKRLPQE